MSYAFSPAAGQWIEISRNGILLPGGGEAGEDVVMSEAFVLSLAPEVRAARGLLEVAETTEPEDAIGWTVEDVAGVPTRAWTVPEEG